MLDLRTTSWGPCPEAPTLRRGTAKLRGPKQQVEPRTLHRKVRRLTGATGRRGGSCVGGGENQVLRRLPSDLNPVLFCDSQLQEKGRERRSPSPSG